jgi:acyl phosphate:glycerol-3-phosphate acyltransferase
VTGLVVAAVAGYFIGTFPSADIAARLATRGQVSLRTSGTGNPGGANAIAVLGKGWGVAVITVDVLKAVLAAAVGSVVGGGDGAHLAAVAAVAGHCFPVWTRFKGGKGVAASGGQCLATFPAYFPFDLLVAFLAVLPKWRSKTFAAVLVSSAIWVGAAMIWWVLDLPNAWGPEPSPALPTAAAASSLMIIYRFVASARPAITA